MTGELNDEVLAPLLALLVHDLRNPLAALHSNIDFVRSSLPGEDAEAHGAVDDVTVSCEALGGVIDNLEIMAQTLSGTEHPQRDERLEPLVAGVVKRYQRAAQSHGVALEYEPGAAAEARVTTHRAMCERALGNLISNAVQHAPSGSVVRVRVVRDGAKHAIEVVDQGPALGAALGDLAFSARGQLASKTGGGRYSRGCGLLCARLAAEAAGAKLQARAAEQAGSVLALSFTAAK
jgi:K+-sensing histidine kinase KdpD